MTTFEKALSFTLKWEGGYSNDPKDPGGETNFGISKRAHPDVDIKNLTVEKAGEIYFKEYWTPSGCEKLEPGLAICHFDTSVNMGISRANKFLAQSGGNTKEYINLRAAHYGALVAAKPVLKKFLVGWLNRLNALKNFIGNV